MTESVLHFGPDSRLMGILTSPDPALYPEVDERPAFVFLNAGIIHHVGPNRLHVRLARSLAKAGFRSFRFDLAGIGDSLPLGTSESVEEEHRSSVKEALDYLQNRGVSDRFVLFGLCSGALLGFRVGAQDPRVVGLVIIDPPVMPRTRKYYLVRAMGVLRRPQVWRRFLLGRYGVLRYVRSVVASALRGNGGGGGVTGGGPR